MFYLLVSDKMVSASPKKLNPITNVEEDVEQEFKGLKVFQEAEDKDSLVGYLNLMLEDRESEIWKQIFITITDDAGMQHELYMIYEWLPSSLILRVEPPIEELKDIVPTRGTHFNSFQKKAIDKHLKEQAKDAKLAAKLAKAG